MHFRSRFRLPALITAAGLIPIGLIGTVAAARSPAHVVKAERSVLTAAQVRRAYDLAFARPPTDGELAFCRRFAAKHGLTQLCLVLLNTNEFSYID